MSGFRYAEMMRIHSHGHDGLRDFWRELYGAWDNYEHEVHELIDAGDHVISIVTDRGRGRASGAEVEIDAFGLWTVRDGKVVRVAWLSTREAVFAAAGVREGP